ncbi:MAG: FtsQ-type POTRA domain-containing protein [Hyphomicrobiales bacterium]|nr:FtsQ-type POTRA domain-containing protein [Hyphomicrobiales bacterium]
MRLPAIAEAQLPAELPHGLRARVVDLVPVSVRRHMRRFSVDRLSAPRGLGTVLAVALFAASGFYGAMLNGEVGTVAGKFVRTGEALTAGLGFGIDTIRITGQRLADEETILAYLGVHKGSSMIFFDAAAARDRVAQAPWIDTAAVLKLFPDTLEVVVTERTPFARWQHDLAVSVIDRSGRVISPVVPGSMAQLPLVVGPGAAERAATLFETLDRWPFLAARVRVASLIAERRWNLVVDNGIEVRLPEGEIASAVGELAALDRDQAILDKDIVAIDLRFNDRFYVRLAPDAAAKRSAALKEEAKKARKKAGARI